MKQLAYAQKTEKELQLFLFDKAEPIEPGYPFEALMMSRLDFDVKVTEVPPVQESEMGNLLTYKLRSLYPGDPESTVFDYKLLVKNKQRLAVIFISSRDTIEEYKRIADRRPLFLSFPITNELMQKHDDEDCVFFYWHRDWIDISIYEKGVFVSSSAVKREKEAFLDFLKLRNMLPRNLKDYMCVVITFEDETDSLKEQSLEFFKDIEKIEYLTVEETLPLLSKKSDSLFHKKNKLSVFALARLDYLLLALIVCLCIFVNKIAMDRDAYLKNLNNTFIKEQDLAKKQAEYKKKVDELSKVLERKPADTFVLLYYVSSIFSNEIKINSMRIETKTETKGKEKIERVIFTIEARYTADPLKYIDRFNKNVFFKDASIVKIDNEKHVFTLTGEFLKGGSNARAQ